MRFDETVRRGREFGASRLATCIFSPAPTVEGERTRKRKWFPSGRKSGQRFETSPRVASSLVTGCGVPPDALTRRRPEFPDGAKRISFFCDQLPPRPNVTLQSVCGEPPPSSTRLR